MFHILVITLDLASEERSTLVPLTQPRKIDISARGCGCVLLGTGFPQLESFINMTVRPGQ